MNAWFYKTMNLLIGHALNSAVHRFVVSQGLPSLVRYVLELSHLVIDFVEYQAWQAAKS